MQTLFVVKHIRDKQELLFHNIKCFEICRGTVLGNPFILRDSNDDEKRNKVIKLYRQYLWQNLCETQNKVPILCNNTGIDVLDHAKLFTVSQIKSALYSYLLWHKQNPNSRIALLCYCHPKPCHGDVIVNCLNYLLQPTLQKIISGGQTGADEAGLLAAKELGLATGGTAPKNYRVCLPDGTDSTNPKLKDYGLVESPSYSYSPRTRQNVLNSDGTAWFGYANSPGGKLTISTCKQLNKPYIVEPNCIELFFFVKTNNIQTLNIAGNRLSDLNPDIVDTTYNHVVKAFSYVK